MTQPQRRSGPHRRPLVVADLRTGLAALTAASACVLLIMSLRYAGRTRASWIDGIMTPRLERVGEEHEWSLERMVDLGNPGPAAVLIALLALVALVARGPVAFLLAVVAPVAAALLGHLVLKPLIGRIDEDGLVFPSTHATVVAAIASVATLLLLDLRLSSGRVLWRGAVGAAFVVVVAAEIAALTVTNYHYLTDGVGGALLALAVVGAVALGLDAVAAALCDAGNATGRGPTAGGGP